MSALQPGEIVEGALAQDVYAADHEVFASGSRIQLTVDHLERRRRTPNDHWPWVLQMFTPRYEKYPTFHSGAVLQSDGKVTPVEVSLVSIAQEMEVHAQRPKTMNGAPPSAAVKPKRSLGQIVTLRASAEDLPVSAARAVAPSPGTPTIEAGTGARIILLGDVRASKSKAGDSFQARLLEPVRAGSRVMLPEGSLFEGKVIRSTPPRTLSRSGSLLLKFTNVATPGGVPIPVAASLTTADFDQRSHTSIDPEGQMKGGRPGKAWMLLNIGVSSGIAKVADDGTQLLVEALVSTATDASTAGVAKIVSTCASGVFMLSRHGRDVVLPKYTQMEIMFDRSVSLPDTPPSPSR